MVFRFHKCLHTVTNIFKWENRYAYRLYISSIQFLLLMLKVYQFIKRKRCSPFSLQPLPTRVPISANMKNLRWRWKVLKIIHRLNKILKIIIRSNKKKHTPIKYEKYLALMRIVYLRWKAHITRNTLTTELEFCNKYNPSVSSGSRVNWILARVDNSNYARERPLEEVSN